MQAEFLFAGFGGQGVMFVGQLLAYAALHNHFEVTWIPSYGPEMRGGTAHCFVIISDHPIGSPIVQNPDHVIVFNNPSFTKYEPLVAPGGLLVRNASLVMQHSKRMDIVELAVPATTIAEELGNVRLANMVLLGALMTTRPFIPIAVIKAALEEHIPPHRRELLNLNYQALDRGVEIAAQPVGA